MMHMRRLTSLAVATAVAAATLVPLASAEARPRNPHGGYSAYNSGDHGGRRYGGPHHQHYVHKKRRSNVGPAIALGIGALMLGIIAAEAGRKQRYADDD